MNQAGCNYLDRHVERSKNAGGSYQMVKEWLARRQKEARKKAHCESVGFHDEYAVFLRVPFRLKLIEELGTSLCVAVIHSIPIWSRGLSGKEAVDVGQRPGGVVGTVRLKPFDSYTRLSGLVGRISLDFGLRELGVTDSYFSLRTIRDIESQAPQVAHRRDEVAELPILDRRDIYYHAFISPSLGETRMLKREIIAQ